MTPLAIFWNLFLYIVWKFRIMELYWIFLYSNLTILRYPEIIEISEKLEDYLERYLPEKFYLRRFFPEKVTRKIFLKCYLKTDDPLLVGIVRNNNVQSRDFYSTLFLSDILHSFTYVEDPKTAPFELESVFALLLDTYLITLMTGIIIPDPKSFLITFTLVSAGWLGIYRLIGEILIADFLTKKVERWFINREFKKIKTLAIVLLPAFTLHSLLLLSLLRFVEGKGWKLEAKLVNYPASRNVTFMDFFLDKLLSDFNLEERFNSEFIPIKCDELKEAIVLFLKEGDNSELERFFKELPGEIEEFVENHVDFSDIALVYVTSKLKNLASKILP